MKHRGFLLSNVRVIEHAEAIAGPWAGLLLADLGAEVIKLESITRMDMARGPGSPTRLSNGPSAFYCDYPNGVVGERLWNRHSLFNARNCSKYGLTLDLTKQKGLQAFMRLVAVSDVYFSNMAVGVAEKLGVTYDALRQTNPGIIYLSATGYGRTGPYAKRVAMGNCIDAAAGLFGLRDYGDGDSTSVSPDVHCDSISASTSVFAILAALYHRDKTGKGMFIDVSMVEASKSHIGEAIVDYSMNRRIGQSLGNRDRLRSPQGCYRCQGNDEWVTLSIASDEEWHKLAEVAGEPGWARDARFSDQSRRLENQDSLDALVESWTSLHSRFEVMAMLQQAGIAAGAVLNDAEIYDDPHLKERGFLQTIHDPDAGRHVYPGRLWRLGETQMPERTHSPTLGEHNEYVLRNIIGMGSDEISALKDDGIIGDAPARPEQTSIEG